MLCACLPSTPLVFFSRLVLLILRADLHPRHAWNDFSVFVLPRLTWPRSRFLSSPDCPCATWITASPPEQEEIRSLGELAASRERDSSRFHLKRAVAVRTRRPMWLACDILIKATAAESASRGLQTAALCHGRRREAITGRFGPSERVAILRQKEHRARLRATASRCGFEHDGRTRRPQAHDGQGPRHGPDRLPRGVGKPPS